MAKMSAKNITVEDYKGENLLIEAILSNDPLASNERVFRANGPKGMRLMVMDKTSTTGAVQQEYINRYGVVEIEDTDEE